MRSPRAQFGRESGAAAVEFALVVPILIALILGIAAFGRGYQIQSTLSMAAREGVRIAAIEKNVALGEDRAEAAATELGLPGAAATSTGSDSCTGPSTDQRARIQVSMVYDFLGFSGFFGSPITMTGKAEMRCGG